MAAPDSRTFRVFVSSTFTDFAEEREILHDVAWPALRQHAQLLGARFVPIDLRWGIHRGAQLAHATVDICLRELERCQHSSPQLHSIVLIGQRYGWRPPPARLSADIMDLLCQQRAEDAVLACYALDINAVPDEWRLLPRARWPREFQGDRGEYALISTIHQLAQDAGVSDRPEFWSITHREVAQSLTSGMAPPLIYVRAISDINTLLEPWNFSDAHATKLLVPDGWTRQQQLIAEVRACGARIEEYVVSRGDSRSWATYLETLCQQVIADAMAAMQLAANRWVSDPSRAAESRKAQEDFQRDRRRVLIGRDKVVAELLEPPGSQQSQPIALLAESGVGKSAVLAEVASRTSCEVIVRFIGAAPGTQTVSELLDDLGQAIPQALGCSRSSGAGAADLQEALGELLKLAGPASPLVVILDAVDQLDSTDQAFEFKWLPQEVPAHAKLIVSCAKGVVSQRLSQARPDLNTVELGPVDRSLAPKVLRALLDQWSRTLTDEQEQGLLESCKPTGLWLALAAERMRGIASFEKTPQLPSSIDGLVNMILTQWQDDHGMQLVARALGLLAVSRTGLTEDELEAALGSDPLIRTEFDSRTHQSWPESETALPDVIWARLRADLDPYLSMQISAGQPVLRFFHQALADIALERFANPVSDADLILHRILHAMFSREVQVLPAGPARERAESERDWHKGRAYPAGNTRGRLSPNLPLEELYVRADAGDGEAMFWLATRLQDLEVSRFWLSAAATAGFTPAMVNLGQLLEESDRTMATAWYARAAGLGDETAKRNLDGLNVVGAAETHALETLLDAAAAAYASGRIMLARKLWSEAAAQGDPEAHRCLGDLAQGQADMARARRHWQDAADAGDVAAMDRLAEDRLIAGDTEGASHFAVQAASLDSVFAMRLLGDIAAGVGDSAAALAWWRRASDRGDVAAQTRIAEVDSGQAVPR